MSDLIKRMRHGRFSSEAELMETLLEAADEIARLRQALEAILVRDEQMIWGEDYEYREALHDMVDTARAALAEGENNE
jgi:succinate dehydrogenase/fumarate reductase flavoprotein subunit